MWKQPILSRYFVPAQQQRSQICFCLLFTDAKLVFLKQPPFLCVSSGAGDTEAWKHCGCFLLVPVLLESLLASSSSYWWKGRALRPQFISQLCQWLWSWTTTLTCPCLWRGGNSHTSCMQEEIKGLTLAMCLLQCLTLYKDSRPFFFLFFLSFLYLSPLFSTQGILTSEDWLLLTTHPSALYRTERIPTFWLMVTDTAVGEPLEPEAKGNFTNTDPVFI